MSHKQSEEESHICQSLVRFDQLRNLGKQMTLGANQKSLSDEVVIVGNSIQRLDDPHSLHEPMGTWSVPLERNDDTGQNLNKMIEGYNDMKVNESQEMQSNFDQKFKRDNVIIDKDKYSPHSFLKEQEIESIGIWSLPVNLLQTIVDNLDQQGALNLMYSHSMFKDVCQKRLYRRIVIYKDKFLDLDGKFRVISKPIFPFPRYSKLCFLLAKFTYVKCSKFHPQESINFRWDLMKQCHTNFSSSETIDTVRKHSACDYIESDPYSGTQQSECFKVVVYETKSEPLKVESSTPVPTSFESVLFSPNIISFVICILLLSLLTKIYERLNEDLRIANKKKLDFFH